MLPIWNNKIGLNILPNWKYSGLNALLNLSDNMALQTPLRTGISPLPMAASGT